MSGVVFTVGSVLRGDDAAGPLLAELLTVHPADDWQVVDGGAAPENHIHEVRALKPDRLLIVDAAEMGLPPGAIRHIDEAYIAQSFLMTTHALPLNFMIASLRETVAEIRFLGVQPKTTEFCEPLTPEVLQAVEEIHRTLVEQGDVAPYPVLPGGSPEDG